MKAFLGFVALAFGGAILFCIIGAVTPIVWDWLWPPAPRARRGVNLLPLAGAFWGLLIGFVGGVLVWDRAFRSRD